MFILVPTESLRFLRQLIINFTVKVFSQAQQQCFRFVEELSHISQHTALVVHVPYPVVQLLLFFVKINQAV